MNKKHKPDDYLVVVSSGMYDVRVYLDFMKDGQTHCNQWKYHRDMMAKQVLRPDWDWDDFAN